MIAMAMQGDTVDTLCQRHLGATAGVTEQAYALNPGLADLGPVLPMGTTLVLPDLAPAAAVASLINLWD